MRLVLATNHLGLGGSESYLLTVAEQFDRLGHEVVIYTPEGGDGVGAASERNLEVVDSAGLPPECEAVLAQDAGVSHELSARYPEVPQLFVAHSGMFDLQAPPQLPGAVSLIVALNDRIATRMRSFAEEVEVARLRQPIDVHRFTPRGSLPERARTALLLSNTPNVDRVGMIEEACSRAGLELRRLGGHGGQTTDPRPIIASAEIVIGYGRSILEAMASGRAAFVYDWKGGDGWVTLESYPAIEAAGFSGQTERNDFDLEGLAAELGGYEPEMGPVNRDLVVGAHSAARHAQELIELLRGLGTRTAPPRSPLEEMARLVRLEWRARAEMHALGHEIERLRQELERQRQDLEASRAETASARDATRAEVERAEAALRQGLEASLSWRVTRPLRAGAAHLRRLLGPG